VWACPGPRGPPSWVRRTSSVPTRSRQLQTRRIDGIGEKDLLYSAAGVLQDVGFNIDESETRLGVIVASKDRSAVTASQVAGAVLLAMLGAYMPADKTHKIRVSLVTRPALASDGTVPPDSQFLRITIQRIVWNTEVRQI